MCPQPSTNPAKPTRQVGNYLSTHAIQQPPLVRGQTSRRGRLLLEEGGNFTVSRLINGRTPWNLKHDMGHSKRLLVASNEEGHHRICQRLHHMSVQEKSTEQNKTTPVSYHIGRL